MKDAQKLYMVEHHLCSSALSACALHHECLIMALVNILLAVKCLVRLQMFSPQPDFLSAWDEVGAGKRNPHKSYVRPYLSTCNFPVASTHLLTAIISIISIL